ncbi:reverse transcriptase domain-containing protein [Tanacetum coccineum]
MLLLQVLEKRKGAFAWKMSDIKGISPSYCTHKILMEDDYKPVIQPQRRLNPKVQDVVKNKIVKLLDSGLIYPISDSSWVSPIHVVPKKGGMTVVLNDNNELIPSRTVTGWRVCIDYRKLNDATRKDHFPLPFIDQIKQDAKPRFIRWVLLLQGFDIKIKDKRGAKNLVADHLSRLENPDLGTFTEEEIADEFPDKHLMVLKTELNNDEPCASVTGRKVYEYGFFWTSIFKDVKDYVMRCDACQRSGNISSRSEMPQNNIQDLNERKEIDELVEVFTSLEVLES